MKIYRKLMISRGMMFDLKFVFGLLAEGAGLRSYLLTFVWCIKGEFLKSFFRCESKKKYLLETLWNMNTSCVTT